MSLVVDRMMLLRLLILLVVLRRGFQLRNWTLESHRATPLEEQKIYNSSKNENGDLQTDEYFNEVRNKQAEEVFKNNSHIDKKMLRNLSATHNYFGFDLSDGLRVAEISEMPSFVLILGQKMNCAGNLISSSTVLTAASCVTQNYYHKLKKDVFYRILKPEQIVLRMGTKTTDSGKIKYAAKIRVHPEYMQNKYLISYKDVAVIHLLNEVELGINTGVAEIHHSINIKEVHQPVRTQCVLGGWGIGLTNTKIFVIQEVSLISLEICDHFYAHKTSASTHVCALNNVSSTCSTLDIGSGLFCDSKILAVVSWTVGCNAGVPNVLARVDNMRSFIDSASLLSSPFSLLIASLITLLIY